MKRPTLRRSLATLLCLSLVLGPWPVRAEEIIRCGGSNWGYRYCRVDTGDRVELVRQHSLVSCRENRSWGYDRHGVWVDHGCAADFRVGRHGGGRDKAIVAGVALAGLAAIIAMNANKQKQATEEVASWSVGSFSGRDDVEGVEVQLTILPGGSVQGRAGDHSFTGSLAGDRLEAGRHVFRVVRSGNGFMATDERDPNHRVNFQRSGSGY